MGRRATVTVTALAVGLVGLGVTVARTAFSESAASTSNVLSTDTLDPPSALSASASGTIINLNWAATPDSYASGHRLLRATVAGGPYVQIAEITPRTGTTYADDPGAGTFYYVARAYFQNWESINSSEASAAVSTATSTDFKNCASNAAVTTGSGDNNGFQLNPASACADDGAFAEDTNGGTAGSLICSSAARDRHLYYDYNFALPGGANIGGVEVRLDAWSDTPGGNPQLCVELSWDGGTSWTPPKTTPRLTATEASYALGHVADPWGRGWSDIEFSNTSFRVRITMLAQNSAREFRLDWLAVQVTYVP